MYLVVTERTWTSGKATGKFKSLGIVNGKCFFLNVFQSALLMSLPGERTMAVESHNWVVKYWWLGLVSTRAAIVVNDEFYFSNVRWHIVVLTEWKISYTRILECWHSAFFPVSPCDLTWMQLQSTFFFCKRTYTFGLYKSYNGRTQNANAYVCKFESIESKFCD